MHEFAQAAPILKSHYSGDLGKERIVAADTYVEPRLELGAPLPDDDGSAADELPAETLHSKSLGLTIPSIPGAPNTLFVRHTDLLACHTDFFNADFGMLLTMSACAAVLLFLFIFENQDFVVLILRLQNANHRRSLH